MPLLPRLAGLWRNLFRKDRVENDLAEEVQTYLETPDDSVERWLRRSCRSAMLLWACFRWRDATG